MDIINQAMQQFKSLQEQVNKPGNVFKHKLASPATIVMAVKIPTRSKIAFPEKFSPWKLREMRQLDIPLNGLYKHYVKFLTLHGKVLWRHGHHQVIRSN